MVANIDKKINVNRKITDCFINAQDKFVFGGFQFVTGNFF